MEQARTFPDDFPSDGVELSYFLVVSDYVRALAFYRDVLRAMVMRELPGILCFLNFRGSQILLSAPDGHTKDKPLVTFVSPPRPEQHHRRTDHSGAGLLGCPTWVLRSRRVEFISSPIEWGDEIRAFFRDPDGHLLEISQNSLQKK